MLERINKYGQNSGSVIYFDSDFGALDLALRSFCLCFAFSVPHRAMKTKTNQRIVISLRDGGGGRISHG